MSIEWKTVYYWGKRRLPVMMAFGQGFVVLEIRKAADQAEATYPGVRLLHQAFQDGRRQSDGRFQVGQWEAYACPGKNYG